MTTDLLSAEVLQAICDAHGLGKIEHSVQPSQGAVNRCWIINDAYVIRFDVIDWGGISRYNGEKRSYDLLRGSDVPVPQVLVLDTSKTLAPYDYLIMTKMPGKTVTSSLDELTPEQQHRIAYTAGEYLATMHSHSFDGFGLLFEIAAGTSKPTWADYVADFYHEYGPQCHALGIVSTETLARVYSLLEKMQPLLASVQQGGFIHGDYHLSNILQHDGQISGVVDFEWAASGDRSWDFRIDNQLEVAAPGSREAFYTGYTSRRPLPDQHKERVAFYRIGLYLDYLATFSVDDPTEVTQTLPLLMSELEWLEAHL